jgi:hypothetical protein
MSHYSSVLKVQELKPMVESPCGPSAPNQGSQSRIREATKNLTTRQANHYCPLVY